MHLSKHVVAINFVGNEQS